MPIDIQRRLRFMSSPAYLRTLAEHKVDTKGARRRLGSKCGRSATSPTPLTMENAAPFSAPIATLSMRRMIEPKQGLSQLTASFGHRARLAVTLTLLFRSPAGQWRLLRHVETSCRFPYAFVRLYHLQHEALECFMQRHSLERLHDSPD
jgi:hypothetical protein